MATIQYSIPNITCGHCVHAIQTEVGDLQGVKSVIADATTKSVKIEFETPANQESIKQLLKEINYPVSETA